MKRTNSIMRWGIGIFLLVYSVVTIIPFYFLFVKSFVPTKESTKLHLWIPKSQDISMDAQFGAIATFYRLDIPQFKEDIGLPGYVNPSLTLREMAEEYDVPEESIRSYLRNYIVYNGYYAIFGAGQFFKHLLGNIFVVVLSLVLGGILGLATGSVLAGFKKRWHLWVYYLYLIQIAISPIMTLLPVYLIMTNYLRLYNSYWALILMFIKGGALSTMVFTAHAASIPKDLKESVEVDGGNHFHYYWHILLPLSKTPFAVFTAISLPLFWNDLLYGFLFLGPEKFTIIPLINSFSGTFATNLQAVYSGLLLATLPLLLVYFLFRKLFARSALAGAIKG